jgi:regulator of CtrA degradation
MTDTHSILHQLDRRLIDGLYVDAMLLADEARYYFDVRSDEHRDALDRIARVEFACESLKVTTRLMHVIAWLLTQRAILNGELRETAREDEQYCLGAATVTPVEVAMGLGAEMASLIAASEDLYNRVARLEQQFLARRHVGRGVTMPQGSPHDLLSRLERAF